MIVVNLYGAPGSGKSTIQADIFRRLKQKGYNAEMMTEYAKLLTWESRADALACQPLIFGKNFYEMTIYAKSVDVLVLDSPLLLSALYGRSSAILHPTAFSDAVAAFSAQFTTMDYLLERTTVYDPKGRRQDALESERVHRECVEMLDHYNINYSVLPGNNETTGERITNAVMARLASRANPL